MRNPRPVLGALGAVAFVAALATVASSQTTSSTASTPAGPKSSDTGSMFSGAAAPDLPTPLRLRAFAVNMNSTGPRNSGTLDIVVERWSTPTEVDRLRTVLEEKPDNLLSAVQKIRPRAGFVRTPNSLGWDLQFARETQLPDGSHRIILGSDRPMSFWELQNQPRSAEYQFMLVEIRLDKDGKGQGTLAPAAMVNYDTDTKTLEIENYSSQPVRLTQVEIVK
ncbi:MAG TPA: hypothetical protein VEQ10_03065 [Vicinamibacteria bacterium]|nr:hypothetical protein [Vicinamibacteria bacterium]